ncbi:sulfatase-like hydrolase/transferase [Paenibacillus ferrarius]|uniref:sulfatase-like hydrolase/transferase n=1 Tax=Paenibacillus ferrarius TaxID=1469647 RepID=UPI003D2E364C
MRKPNILFLLADDQRFDMIGALGHPDVLTPNLDRLVERGTFFKEAHIPGGTVGAVCMPSRAMLHTGRTLFHIHDDGRTIPDEHVMLGEWLREAGYCTFGTGKWHNGGRAFNRSFQDGAELFMGGMEDHWNVPAFRYDPSGAYDKTQPFIRDPMYTKRVEQRWCDHVHAGVHSTDLFSGTAVDWLRRCDSEQPFFLYVSYMAPHDPRSMPHKYRQMYDVSALTLPKNFAPEHCFDYGVRDIRDERLAPYPRTEADIREQLADYYAMITHLDDRLGDVLETLREIGQEDNTIVVFAGDNGLAVGQHGLMGKQSCYEHSVRVPLVFAGPGVPRGTQRDDYVYLSDIFPTLCELSGLPVPTSVEGVSLAPLFFGSAVKDSQSAEDGHPDYSGRGQHHLSILHGRERIFLAYADLVRAVKERHYKLIVYQDPSASQLFDLRKDPMECQNLYGQPSLNAVARSMLEKLVLHSVSSGDREHPAGRKFWNSRMKDTITPDQ